MSGQCRVKTYTLQGVEAVPVEVEVDIGPGLPSFAIVGLPDAAIQEARERVRSGLKAAGFELPSARVVVNLAPGPLRKHGTGFDLPIALGLLVATRQLPPSVIDSTAVVGELSLDGSVRPAPGMIAYAMRAECDGLALLAAPGATGLGEMDNLRYLPLRNVARLRQGLPERAYGEPLPREETMSEDFSEVVGQESAIRALLIAAAGGHNVLMMGPPGAGKTMLARRLAEILPPLTHEERLETALVHSVAGLDPSTVLAGRRPFRAPHHSASIAGVVGGGSPPRPGEASLAHNGVLFLDEMPEFGPAVLQCLRQPLEDKRMVIVRADGRIAFPADFALVGAANPCPCGFYGDPGRDCRCPGSVIDRYRNRIGGPLLDRIDLLVQVDRPDPASLLALPNGTSSRSLRGSVIEARDRAMCRSGSSFSRLTGARLLEACRLGEASSRVLEDAARRQHLSGRGITRVLRVSRTIADLEGSDVVEPDHMWEALGYRVVDGAVG